MESSDTLTLMQAVGLYLESYKGKPVQEATHRELIRFIQWCGPEREISGINPSEIGDYADNVGGTGTRPMAADRLQVVRGFLSYARKRGLTERNLAQHVRIRKSKSRISADSKRQDQKVIQLTAEGHASLVKQLEKLKSERAPLAVQIQKAAADKDVRENAPLEAAREQLGLVESKIRELEDQLKNAVIMDRNMVKVSRTVKLGMRVSVKELDSGRETSYTLVSQTESNPLNKKISDVSPLGKALLGMAVGQEVTVDTPRGMLKYKVTKVSA